MSTIEMTAGIRQLKELEALIKEAQEEAEAIKDLLKAEMTAQGTQEMTVDVYTVRYKTVTSRRLDSKKLKADHADLYNAYTTETTSCRFTVA